MSKLLKRLQKLKALADDPHGNPNETSTAAALYAEMLAEHGFTQQQVEIETSEINSYDFLEPGQDSMESWQRILLNGVALASCCEMLQRHRDEGDTAPENVLIVGASDNVAAVQYGFQALRRQVISLCDTWAERKGRRPSFIWLFDGRAVEMDMPSDMFGQTAKPVTEQERSEFCKGVAVNLSHRLVEAYQARVRKAEREARQAKTQSRPENQGAAPPGALVLIDRQKERVKEHIDEKFGDNVGKHREKVDPTQAAFRAGVHEGSKIPIDGGGPALGAEKRRIERRA